MHRTQIYLPPEQHRALLNEAAQKGISLAELVRKIVAEHLKQQEEIPVKAKKSVFMRIVGLGASRKIDTSERHDYYLAEALVDDHG